MNSGVRGNEHQGHSAELLKWGSGRADEYRLFEGVGGWTRQRSIFIERSDYQPLLLFRPWLDLSPPKPFDFSGPVFFASTASVVAEPPKLLGPHAPALVSKASDDYACAPDNLIGSVRLPQGHRINHL